MFWIPFFFFCCLTSVSYAESSLELLQKEADQAFMIHEWSLAEKKYQQFLSQASSLIQKEPCSTDLITRFSNVLTHLVNLYEQNHRLNHALETLTWGLHFLPPSHQKVSLEVQKAKVLCQLKRPEEALASLTSLKENSNEDQWDPLASSFYAALEKMVEDQIDLSLAKAKHQGLCEEYQQALATYDEIQRRVDLFLSFKKSEKYLFLKKFIQYKIAQTHYLAKEFDLAVCSEVEPTSSLDLEQIYLTACAHLEQHRYQEAIQFFLQYLSSKEQTQLVHFHQALLEIGLIYLKTKEFNKASEIFSFLIEDSKTPSEIKTLSYLHSTRICLEKNDLKLAHEYLSHLEAKQLKQPLLTAELLFLKGKVAYFEGQWKEGKEWIQIALQQPGISKNWKSHAKFILALLNLQEGKLQFSNNLNGTALFQEAKTLLYSLQTSDLWPQATLYLAKMTLLESTSLNKPYCLDTIRYLFKNNETFPVTQKALSYLILAEVFPKEAESWYSKAIEESRSDPIHSFCLIQFALYTLKQGLKESSIEKLSLAQTVLEQAVSLANFEEKKQISYLQSILCLFENHCHQAIDLLAQSEWKTPYQSSLKALIQCLYPEYQFPEDEDFKKFLPYIEGVIAYKKHLFKEAITHFESIDQTHPFKTQAIFWQAMATKAIGNDPTLLFESIYEKFQNHHLAPEACYRVFHQDLYASGDPEALNHLQTLISKFPSSYYCALAWYFLGKNSTSFEQKKFFLNRVIESSFVIQDSEALDLLHFYQTRAKLDLASAFLKENCFEEAEAHCVDIITLSYEKDFDPSVQEAFYLRGLILLAQGQKGLATQIFSKMTEKCRELYIHDSKFLSLAWLELGKLAQENGDLKTALSCFELAEKSGERTLSDRQHLVIWMLQSDLYRIEKDLISSMRLLSKIINANVASSLRMEAMYKRAEIYEIQGRADLAIRQLEAIVKKGGPWGKKAEIKLRKDHGV